MDLIDREALQDKIWDIRTEIDSGLMLTIINHMPTIDAEPVRHGKWERVEYSFVGGYRCSCCGSKALDDSFNYCGYCGAKMDGE